MIKAIPRLISIRPSLPHWLPPVPRPLSVSAKPVFVFSHRCFRIMATAAGYPPYKVISKCDPDKGSVHNIISITDDFLEVCGKRIESTTDELSATPPSNSDLTKLHVHVIKYPAWDDRVELNPAFEGRDTVSGDIHGKQEWSMKLDDASAQEMAYFMMGCTESAIITKLEGPLIFTDVGFPVYTSTLIEDFDPRADLDKNGNIKISTIIGLLLKTMPEEVVESYEVQALTLQNKSEEFLLDVNAMESRSGLEYPAKADGSGLHTFLHLLKPPGNGAVTTRGRSVWRKKKA